MATDLAAMQAYYARDKERDRLVSGVGQVEYLRTVEVVGRTLPPAPAIVADIGGGPGRYTDWLVEAGYTVLHRDVVEHHVSQVADRHGSAVDTAVGDARWLDLSVAFHRHAGAHDWLLCDGSAPVSTEGLFGWNARVWSADGRLHASGGGQCLYRRVQPPPG